MREISYVEAVREALHQAMTADERVVVIGEDVAVYGGVFGATVGLLEKFGEARVIDTPISEAGIAGACIGMALTGLRPVGDMQFSDFILLSLEQLVHQAAKMPYMFGGAVKIPMVMRLPTGSGTGAAAQHSGNFEAWFAHIPGLKVAMPSNPYDAKGLLLSAIDDENPVMFFEHKLLYKTKGEVPEAMYRVPFGQTAHVRKGVHMTVVATSHMVSKCMAASEALAKDGIEIDLFDPRTIAPFDAEPILESVKRTGRLLVAQEAQATGGFAGEIITRVVLSEAFDYLEAPPRRVAGLDIPIPYAKNLETAAVPQIDDIVAAARALRQNT
jgi:acetoin:2,6-dichlorophenolindophenol oxidoreductase subunit beta